MKRYIFYIFLAIYLCLFYFIIGLHFPLWTDEGHFINTSYFFADNGISAIMNYNEMSTPLPFILYGIWANIFGKNLHNMRILSIIISFLTFSIFYTFLKRYLKNTLLPIIGTLFFMFNPYIIGLSVFVYTDMLAILFFILSIFFFFNQKYYSSSLFISLSILCRQYFVFAAIAYMIFWFLYFLNKGKETKKYKKIFIYFLSLIPIMILFYLWKGLAPPNELKEIYLKSHYYFNINNLIIYISLISFYLFPLYIRFLILKIDKKIIFYCITISFLYILFPLKTSSVSLKAGITTIGFLHKILMKIGGNTLSQILFFIAFYFGLCIILCMIKNIKNKIYNKDFIFYIFLLLFLIIMSFSYLLWEKYFIPVLIILIPFFLNSNGTKSKNRILHL